MQGEGKSGKDKLAQLIEEHEKDRKSYRAFPDRINPRKQLLFPALTPRVKVCFLLSFIMKRREIAAVLKIKPCTVSKHRDRAHQLLTQDEVKKYHRMRFG